jgi:hypothetical protein
VGHFLKEFLTKPVFQGYNTKSWHTLVLGTTNLI